MPSRAHGPEPCASANFATRADLATLPQCAASGWPPRVAHLRPDFGEIGRILGRMWATRGRTERARVHRSVSSAGGMFARQPGLSVPPTDSPTNIYIVTGKVGRE